MKKLMIALAVVAMGVAASAATVSWSTGTLRGAADKDGGWGSTSLANSAVDSTWYAQVILVSSDLSTKTSQELWNTYGNSDITKLNTTTQTKTNPGDTVGVKKTSGSSATLVTDATKGTTYYAVFLAAYTDKNLNKDFYMAAATKIDGTVIDNPGNDYPVGQILTNWSDKNWHAVSAVPEPTSGLLLLLGMAGLALRRRRA